MSTNETTANRAVTAVPVRPDRVFGLRHVGPCWEVLRDNERADEETSPHYHELSEAVEANRQRQADELGELEDGVPSFTGLVVAACWEAGCARCGVDAEFDGAVHWPNATLALEAATSWCGEGWRVVAGDLLCNACGLEVDQEDDDWRRAAGPGQLVFDAVIA